MIASLTSRRMMPHWPEAARARPAIWRVLLGLALIATCYAGLNSGALLLYGAVLGRDASMELLQQVATAETPAATLILLVTFGPLAIGAILAAKLLHRRGANSLTGQMWPDLRTALAVTTIIYLPFVILGALFMQDTSAMLPVGVWLGVMPIALLAIGLQTFAEELTFRGYLQQQLGARWAFRFAWMVVPSILFGALHYDRTTFGDSALYGVFAATVFGFLAADLTERSGSLGAAWGFHFANNAFALLIIATDGTITGLALRITEHRASEITLSPLLAVADLLPPLIVWIILRRILSR
ncbi:CPBP family intramembrane glutamic endopeptidase [Qingshengfaniella alkalisoli]|uniref:CPBP family intramembrane metalloprotease n=1 Tax=Qingshengfaniella alkalisoli TaxID=2599296 RepID=A0A5B8IUX5_9RHOB|nr:CPBP family intramembrane glutamic endopeptidase [Qingshengfaniella alkalisoli]QDY69922.1 CPBP family intramembrane metalloprotease [Qingshengfaniella alkalisoli]